MNSFTKLDSKLDINSDSKNNNFPFTDDDVKHMAYNLLPPDFIHFCFSSRKYNRIIFNDKVFWQNKLKKDYPNILSYASASSSSPNLHIGNNISIPTTTTPIPTQPIPTIQTPTTTPTPTPTNLNIRKKSQTIQSIENLDKKSQSISIFPTVIPKIKQIFGKSQSYNSIFKSEPIENSQNIYLQTYNKHLQQIEKILEFSERNMIEIYYKAYFECFVSLQSLQTLESLESSQSLEIIKNENESVIHRKKFKVEKVFNKISLKYKISNYTLQQIYKIINLNNQ